MVCVWCERLLVLSTGTYNAGVTGAKEFKAKYEEAMDVNEKLLASDEAAAAAQPKEDETEALADKVKESVSVADK